MVNMVFEWIVLIALAVAAVLTIYCFLAPCVCRNGKFDLTETNRMFSYGSDLIALIVLLTVTYYYGGFACLCAFLLTGEFLLIDKLLYKKKEYAFDEKYRAFAIASIVRVIVKLLFTATAVVLVLYLLFQSYINLYGMCGPNGLVNNSAINYRA